VLAAVSRYVTPLLKTTQGERY